MPHIFLSYSSKDRELVTALASDLEALGNKVWFDAELTRTGGQKWWSNILTNLRASELFVFALTPNSLASDPCRREYSYAHALQKRILPVMLNSVDVSILPAALQQIQFVDYRERTSRQGVALSASLNNLPPMQPMPEPLPPEPDVPMTPLARLSETLDSASLTGTQQVEIVFELESLYNAPATHSGADTLLRRLHERDDLTSRVADKIRALIPDISGVQPRAQVAEAKKPDPVPVRQEVPARSIPTQAPAVPVSHTVRVAPKVSEAKTITPPVSGNESNMSTLTAIKRPRVIGIAVLCILIGILDALLGLAVFENGGSVLLAMIPMILGVISFVTAVLLLMYKRIGLILAAITFGLGLLDGILNVATGKVIGGGVVIYIGVIILYLILLYFLYIYLTGEPQKTFFK